MSDIRGAIAQFMRQRLQLPEPAERRALRQRAGMSMRELACVVGVSTTTIHEWETGGRRPTGMRFGAYVEALNAIRAELGEASGVPLGPVLVDDEWRAAVANTNAV